MSQWRRPYKQRIRPFLHLYAAFFSVFGFLPLCGIGGLPSDGGEWAGTMVLIAFVALWQAIVWRSALVGLYVGPPGIRLRTMLRTRTIPWADVHRVLVVDDPQYRNRGLAIVTRWGTRVETPVWQFAWQWLRARGPASREFLAPAELDALAAELDTMVAAARTGRARF